MSENRYTLEDIKASIPSCKVDFAPLYEKPRRKSTVTLEEDVYKRQDNIRVYYKGEILETSPARIKNVKEIKKI